jgi:aldose 1-epimerase
MKRRLLSLLLISISLCFATCFFEKKMGLNLISSETFNTIIDDQEVKLYTLKNKWGVTAQITNYGGRVVSLWLPDKTGHFEDVVLGFNDMDTYEKSKEKYFGALIGRYGNRIAKGRFVLEDSTYLLVKNNGENHLHGGNKGFESVVWKVNSFTENKLFLSYFSPHMEEGYPGNLTVSVEYQLTDENELSIQYFAQSDQTTIINLTHHSFFNLKGAGNGNVNDHLLQINADYFTPIDDQLIPTGVIQKVVNTPFDFLLPTQIGSRIDALDDQLTYGHGYDHNYVLNPSDSIVSFAARVVEPVSKRTLEVYTNEPGMQFYGGNFLDGTVKGKKDKNYEHRGAFCLETQHFPDSPNKIKFPSTSLAAEEPYYSICIYKFGLL